MPCPSFDREAIEAEIDDSTSFAPCGARHAAARSKDRVAGGQLTDETDRLTSVRASRSIGPGPRRVSALRFGAWANGRLGRQGSKRPSAPTAKP
jgi:hypothetical protein